MDVIAERNFTHQARRVALSVLNGGSDEQRNRRQPRWRARQLGWCIEGLVQRSQISREWRPVGKWLFRRQLAEYDWKSVRRWAWQRGASRKSLTNCSSRVAHAHSQSAQNIFLEILPSTHRGSRARSPNRKTSPLSRGIHTAARSSVQPRDWSDINGGGRVIAGTVG